LTWLTDERRTFGGHGREDYFAYNSHFAALPGIRAVVRLEPGVQSGTFPTQVVPLTSLVAQFLQEDGAGEMADDLAGFDMTLLHFRRTFVEKLFAIHGKVVRLVGEGVALGRDARHYADLYALAGTHEVRAMLASPEYAEIRDDYDAKSRQFFASIYRRAATADRGRIRVTVPIAVRRELSELHRGLRPLRRDPQSPVKRVLSAITVSSPALITRIPRAGRAPGVMSLTSSP
jgi:hypothetical protein